jgi:hypothetical protein
MERTAIAANNGSINRAGNVWGRRMTEVISSPIWRARLIVRDQYHPAIRP